MPHDGMVSMSNDQVTLKSDRYTRMLAEIGVRAFIDRDFMMTMRFSELNGGEEFDNAMAFAIWHGYLETGIQQIRAYADGIVQLQREPDKWNSVPEDQKTRISDLLEKFKKYDDSKPVDHKDKIRIIRNYLQYYNENLMDGVIFYDIHTAILNGRFAKGRAGMKEILEMSKTALQREFDIVVARTRSDENKSFVRKVLGKVPGVQNWLIGSGS